MLGQKKQQDLRMVSATQSTLCEPMRRVIASVPDFHSRKPCLKELIEPLMAERADYRALEVFARNLVAGWWSWGDECTKFNEESFWEASTEEE